MQNLIKSVAPNGGVTTYEYDKIGDLTKTTDALNNVTTQSFDLNGLLKEQDLPNGGKYTYNYDTLQRLTKIQAPEGVSQSFTYNEKGDIVEQKDSKDNTTTFGYDIMHNMTSATDAQGNKTSYAYNGAGDLTSVINPNGGTTNYTYDPMDRVTAQTDPTGLVTTFEYDVLGNLTKQDKSGGRVTSYAYDNLGNLISTTNALGATNTYTYDKNSQLTKITDALGFSTSASYDANGQITSTTDAKNNTTSYAYDNMGNITSVTNKLGNSKQYGYDVLGRLTSVTDEKGVQTSYTYDNMGNLTSTTDGNGSTTTYTYDQLSRLTSQTNALNQTQTYTYDTLNNVKEITKPDGQKIDYDYNQINQLVSQTAATDEDSNAMYAYDAAGQLITMSDITGTSGYEYDSDGRVTKANLTGGRSLQYKYDSLGRLAELVYPDGTSVKYGYDTLDRMVSVTDRNGGVTTYEYDADNRPIKCNRPNSTYTTITYDELGQITYLENDNTNGTLISRFVYTYNAEGQIVTEVSKNNAAEVTRNISYDDRGEITGFLETQGTNKRVVSYAYDNAGNRTGRVSNYTGQAQITTKYTYNIAEQLTQQKQTSGSTTTTTNYTYDANGNQIKASATTGNTTTNTNYVYDVENRLTVVKSGGNILLASIYDGNGDRVFSVSPKSVADASVKYTATAKDVNGDGTISITDMEKANAGKDVPFYELVFIPLGIAYTDKNKYTLTTYINDTTQANTQVLQEYNKGGNVQATYAYGANDDRISYDDGTTNWTYMNDGRGSVSNITGPKGVNVVDYEYHMFGELISQDGTTSSNYNYNAENTDPTTGLQYLRARYYQPDMGRFLSSDTYSGTLSDPLTMNRYIYAGNDPYNMVDPSGHNFIDDIKNTAQNAWNTTKTAASNAWNGITATYNNAVNYVNDFIQDPVGTAINTINSVIATYNNVKNGINNVTKSNGTPGQKVIGVVSQIASVPSQLAYNYNVSSTYTQNMANLKTAISNAKTSQERNYLTNVMNQLTEHYKQVCSSTQTLQSQLAGIGNYFTNTLTKTIEGTGLGLYDTGSSIISSIGQLAKNLVGPDLSNMSASLQHMVGIMSTEEYNEAIANGNSAQGVAMNGIVQGIINLPSSVVGDVKTASSLPGDVLNPASTTQDVAKDVGSVVNLAILILGTKGVGEGITKAVTEGATEDVVRGTLVDGTIINESEMTTVGRWMSVDEYEAMNNTNRVQMSANNVTSVSNPADPNSYNAAPKGSVYVEFDVPTSSIRQGGNSNWGLISGPGSMWDRLDQSKGLPPITAMPTATNIRLMIGGN